MDRFIRKTRKVVNGVPLTLMQKCCINEGEQVVEEQQGISHSSLTDLLANDHPQYTLTGDTAAKIAQVAEAANESIQQLRTAIVTGEVDVADVNALQALADQQNLATADSTTFTLAGISITTQPPAPDNILAYEPVTNTLVWRPVADLLAENTNLEELIAAVEANAAAIVANTTRIETLEGQIRDVLVLVSQVASNTSDIANIESTLGGYEDNFDSRWIKADMLHMSFNITDEWVDPAYPWWSHGICWADQPPLSNATPRNFFGIDVGGESAAAAALGYDQGYYFGGKQANTDYGITSLSMRFTMDTIAGRGWVFAGRAGNNAFPRFGITNAGQLLIRSGMTFLTKEPTFLIGSAATLEMAGKDNYVFTYNEALSACTFEPAAGSGGVAEYTDVTFDNITATTLTTTGAGLNINAGEGFITGRTISATTIFSGDTDLSDILAAISGGTASLGEITFSGGTQYFNKDGADDANLQLYFRSATYTSNVAAGLEFDPAAGELGIFSNQGTKQVTIGNTTTSFKIGPDFIYLDHGVNEDHFLSFRSGSSVYAEFGWDDAVKAFTTRSPFSAATSVSAATVVASTYSGLTKEKSVSILDPQAGDEVTLWKTSREIEITKITLVAVGSSPTATWAVNFDGDRSEASPSQVTGGTTQSISTVSGTTCTVFTNSTIPADRWLWLEITATGGTSWDEFHATIEYQES